MDALAPVLFILFIVVFFGGIIWLALHFGRKQANKTWDHYVRLGQQFGITVMKPNIGYFMPPLARLEGTYRSIVLSLHTEKRRSGKNTYVYTVMNIRLFGNPGFEFKLVKEGFFQKIGKAFGMQDIQIGNETFDKLFVLKSPDENRARQIFDMMFCNKLVENEKSIRSAITLNNGVMHYEEMMMMNSEDNLNRISTVINLCTEIAEKITNGGQRARY